MCHLDSLTTRGASVRAFPRTGPRGPVQLGGRFGQNSQLSRETPRLSTLLHGSRRGGEAPPRLAIGRARQGRVYARDEAVELLHVGGEELLRRRVPHFPIVRDE